MLAVSSCSELKPATLSRMMRSNCLQLQIVKRMATKKDETTFPLSDGLEFTTSTIISTASSAFLKVLKLEGWVVTQS